jgi:hypothetical protein
LATICGLNTTIEATRELKSVWGVDVCIETMRNALVEVGLWSIENISKPACLLKMQKKGWNLLKCTRIGQWVIGMDEFLVMRLGSIFYILMELVGVGFVIIKNLPSCTIK